MRRFEHDSKQKGEELKSLQNRFDSLTITLRTKKDELEKIKEQAIKGGSGVSTPASAVSTPTTARTQAPTTTATPTPTPTESSSQGGSFLGTVAMSVSLLAVGVLSGAYVGMKMKHQ